MTTVKPRHESKAMRRVRLSLEKRTKEYQATLKAKGNSGDSARAQQAHKPGSNKKGRWS